MTEKVQDNTNYNYRTEYVTLRVIYQQLLEDYQFLKHRFKDLSSANTELRLENGLLKSDLKTLREITRR